MEFAEFNKILIKLIEHSFNMTELSKMSTTIKRRKWNSFGHILRRLINNVVAEAKANGKQVGSQNRIKC